MQPFRARLRNYFITVVPRRLRIQFTIVMPGRLRIYFSIVVPGKTAYLFIVAPGGGTGSKIGIDLSRGRLSSARGRGLFFSCSRKQCFISSLLLCISLLPPARRLYMSQRSRARKKSRKDFPPSEASYRRQAALYLSSPVVPETTTRCMNKWLRKYKSPKKEGSFSELSVNGCAPEYYRLFLLERSRRIRRNRFAISR